GHAAVLGDQLHRLVAGDVVDERGSGIRVLRLGGDREGDAGASRGGDRTVGPGRWRGCRSRRGGRGRVSSGAPQKIAAGTGSASWGPAAGSVWPVRAKNTSSRPPESAAPSAV